MKCPNCKTNITSVWVVSESAQMCSLNRNKIYEYGDVEMGEPKRIECSFCGADIQEKINLE